MTANKAVLDYASRNREQLLYNIWLMGKNAIERGSRDSWTITPKIVEAAHEAGGGGGRRARVRAAPRSSRRFFHDPPSAIRAASSFPAISPIS